ncbi:hypothetical protein LH128_01744, partial [Sphingomonas sp. LH128]
YAALRARALDHRLVFWRFIVIGRDRRRAHKIAQIQLPLISQNDAGAFRSIAECLLGHAFEERAQLSVFSPEFPHKGGHLLEIVRKIIGFGRHA